MLASYSWGLQEVQLKTQHLPLQPTVSPISRSQPSLPRTHRAASEPESCKTWGQAVAYIREKLVMIHFNNSSKIYLLLNGKN